MTTENCAGDAEQQRSKLRGAQCGTTHRRPVGKRRVTIYDVNAAGVLAVARSLGIENVRGPRGASGGDLPCPACGAVRRHPGRRDRRGAVGLRRDGLAGRCHECNQGFDAVRYAAWQVLGRIPRDSADWRRVFERCVSAGLCSPMLPTGSAPFRQPSVAMPDLRTRRRIPVEELASFWSSCRPVNQTVINPNPADLAAAWFLASRGFYAPDVAALDLARLLPSQRGSWPKWWPRRWALTWRLVVPAFEPDGTMASLHGRAVIPNAEIQAQGLPKTRWAFGCGRFDTGAGLLFGGLNGLGLLRGEAAELEAVQVVEGMTDTIAASLRAHRLGLRRAVLGVVSGGPPALARVRWPVGLKVIVSTDADAAGDRLASECRAAIPPSVEVFRRRHSQPTAAQ